MCAGYGLLASRGDSGVQAERKERGKRSKTDRTVHVLKLLIQKGPGVRKDLRQTSTVGAVDAFWFD